MTEIEEIYYINSSEEQAFLQVSTHFLELMAPWKNQRKFGPAFVCIGSDRVTGDSLGPIIGSDLKRHLPPHVPVYGTLEAPLHALNLNYLLPELKRETRHHILIAIDASLGTKEHQGYITLGNGCLSPGAGVDKVLESVGDIFITGIIGPSGPFSHLTLQTARLSSVISIANQISAGILHACSL